MTKIQPSFFFETREELYTGEESSLQLLLNRKSLNNDIYNHINSFLGEIKLSNVSDKNSYLICYDNFNREFCYPIDEDEKQCFEEPWEEDFIIN
jgi:hypothetical protein